MKMRKKSRQRIDAPLHYGHRVEAWMRASHFGIRGVNFLLHALLLQQTPAWKKQRKRLRAALKAFEDAANWTRISQNCPQQRPTKLEINEEGQAGKS